MNSPLVDLRLGDCLEVMPSIPDGSVDMILADLPYGTTACKWDTVIPLVPLWEQYKRVIKRNGAIVLTASQPFTSALVMSNPRWFKCEWVWEKDRGSNFATVAYMPMKEHESVLVFAEGKTTYNPIPIPRSETGKARAKTPRNPTTLEKRDVYSGFVDTRITHYKSVDMRCPRSIIRFNRDRGLHPTQKPVALMEYLIRTYTNEGETVLDNTMGSGTTGVACINTGRNFIGIEKDAGYFQIATERIRKAQDAPVQADMGLAG